MGVKVDMTPRPEVAAFAADFGPTTVDRIHRGQTRMAYRLAHGRGRELMHVFGIGWHYYDGKRWVEDDRGMTTQALLEVLRDSWADAQNDKELEKDVRRCESGSAQNGVLGIAGNLPEFAYTVGDLDADPYLLNCANGTLDLRTMELRAHDPADRITKVCAAAYRPDATGPVWEAFLAKVLPDVEVREFLQRYVGQALCGTVLEHTLAILTGTGRNGKGKFYGAMCYALGDYSHSAEPDLFMHREGAHPVGEMNLRGRRWVVVSETEEDRRLAQATMKRLTGGDKINARRLYGQPVEFTPSHSIALVTNHLPKVKGDDVAIWSRLGVIPFDVFITPEERDVHLPAKLELEADAVLTWAIQGWQDYTSRGRLDEPDAVIAKTDAYKLESDPMARFIDECCLVNPHMRAPKPEFWERWCRWAIEDGTEQGSQKSLAANMDRLKYRDGKSGALRFWAGLGLAAEDDE